MSDLHGWIVLDKPKGLSSAKALHQVKKALKLKKVGHCGTLDPLATGVLPIAVGEATKAVSYIMDQTKTYEFEVIWGEERSTDDLEGEVTNTSPHRPSKQDIIDILQEFTGEITQTPPAYSAIKVGGRRAYQLAHKGEDPKISPRKITVFTLELLETTPKSATFRAKCGKGTYIRSLGRDMARKLGTFGHIGALRRLQVGKFEEKCTILLEKFASLGHNIRDYLLPVIEPLDDIPALVINSLEETALRQGRFLEHRDTSNPLTEKDIAICVHEDGRPVAFVTYEEGSLRPKRVFNIT